MRNLPLLSNLFSLFRAPTGFGSAGIRRHRICGALIIYGDWAGQRGVELDEVGISVRAVDVTYKPFVNEKLLSNVGEPRARAISGKFSREVTISGEVTGTTGIMAFDLGVECTVANDVADFGDGTGDLLLDEATVNQERAGWRSVTVKLSSDPGVVE